MKKLLLCLMATSSLYAVQVEVHNICGIAQPDTIKITNPLDTDFQLRFAIMAPSDRVGTDWKTTIRDGGYHFLRGNNPYTVNSSLHGNMSLCALTMWKDEAEEKLLNHCMMSPSVVCSSSADTVYPLPQHHAFGYILGIAHVKQKKNSGEGSALIERTFGWTSTVEDGLVHLTLTNNPNQIEPIPQAPYVVQKDLLQAYNLYKQYYVHGNPGANWFNFINDFTSQGSGVTDVKRPEEVVINLYSGSWNIENVWLDIERFMHQSEKPDRIVLNLCENEFPGKVLPFPIRKQMERGLEINWNGPLHNAQEIKLSDIYYRSMIYGIGKNFYGLTDFEMDSNLRHISIKNNMIYNHAVDGLSLKIPFLTHRIWLTDNRKPALVDSARLERYLQSLDVFPNSCEHTFWCLNKQTIDANVSHLISRNSKLKIREIKEVSEHFILKDLIADLIHDGYYTFASDLIRKEILYMFGGLYSDIGVLYKKDFTDMFYKFNNLFLLHDRGELDIGMIASTSHSDLLYDDLHWIKSLLDGSCKSLVVKSDASEVNHAILSSYHIHVLYADNVKKEKYGQCGFFNPHDYELTRGAGHWMSRPLQGSSYLKGRSEQDYFPSITMNFIFPLEYFGDSIVLGMFKNACQQFGICSELRASSISGSDQNIYDPNFVVSLDYYDARKTLANLGGYTYLYSQTGSILNMKRKEEHVRDFQVKQIFQFLLPVAGNNEELTSYCKYGFYREPFYFTHPATSFQEYEILEPELSFFGGIWDGRYKTLLDLLDRNSDFFKWYGPKSLEGKKSYQGFADSVVDAIQKHKICLLLHSPWHLENHEPSGRVFEAVAAGAVVITDKHPFIERYFGDSVFYLDQNTLSEENMYLKLLEYIAWIKDNSQLAVEKAKRAHSIFIQNFTLENEIHKLVQVHQNALILNGQQPLNPRRNFSYEINSSDTKRISQILKTIMQKEIRIVNNSDTYINVGFVLKDNCFGLDSERNIRIAPAENSRHYLNQFIMSFNLDQQKDVALQWDYLDHLTVVIN